MSKTTEENKQNQTSVDPRMMQAMYGMMPEEDEIDLNVITLQDMLNEQISKP